MRSASDHGSNLRNYSMKPRLHPLVALSRPLVLICAVSLSMYAAFSGILLFSFGRQELLFVVTVLTLCVFSAVTVVAKAAVKQLGIYAVLHVSHVVLLVFFGITARGRTNLDVVLVAVFLVETGLYLPSQWRLAGTLLSGLFIWVVGVFPSGEEAFFFPAFFELLVVLAASAVGVGFGRNRERLVEAQADVRRLQSAVAQLTRTSLSYQEYAQDAAERSIEQERHRITRDIHDVVGYTLTNNIMMMEAATDMIRRNPLGVTSLIEAARENAQEGLEQIRTALYELRSREIRGPVGLSAVARLVRIFQQATAIDVNVDFTNTPIALSPAADSTVYHFVQEGLINSFRHGRATRIDLVVAEHDDTLEVALQDNGHAAAAVHEGIGIQGMRERAVKLGGSVVHHAGPLGFTIHLRIPIKREDTTL